jgi:hypothetical protein
MRKDIEETFKSMSDSNTTLAKMMGDTKKAELANEVMPIPGYRIVT